MRKSKRSHVTLHRWPLRRADIAAMPEDERRLFILCGHIANELGQLVRLALFSLKAYPNKVVDQYSFGRSAIIIRLLVGKTFEGHEVLKKHVFGSRFRESHLPNMSAEGKAAHTLLNQLFGKGMLAKLRNMSFHNPTADEIDAGFALIGDDTDCTVYMAENRTNNYNHLAESVVIRAMLAIAGEADVAKAMARLAGETMDAAGALSDFIEALLGTLIAQCAALNAPLEKATVVQRAPNALTYRIPPITSTGR